MIVANMATYPARGQHLRQVVDSLLPQVDRINLVFNEYDTIPDWAATADKINAVIPERDQKDVGKFYVETPDAHCVAFVDDDIIFPTDYVHASITRIKALPTDRTFCGYHGSVYEKPRFGLTPSRMFKYVSPLETVIQRSRRNFVFTRLLEKPTVVDQIATNTSFIRGSDMPPYAYMKDSQKFVDVRLAKWCFEKGITSVCLPRTKGWLDEYRYDETIYHGFTRRGHPQVGREVLSYAFKTPQVGQPL